MTSGDHVYTSDTRVNLLREGKFHDTWTLKILRVTQKDAGSYECQVNTEPKITTILHLVVLSK